MLYLRSIDAIRQSVGRKADDEQMPSYPLDEFWIRISRDTEKR
jgi:hypothetical protein